MNEHSQTNQENTRPEYSIAGAAEESWIFQCTWTEYSEDRSAFMFVRAGWLVGSMTKDEKCFLPVECESHHGEDRSDEYTVSIYAMTKEDAELATSMWTSYTQGNWINTKERLVKTLRFKGRAKIDIGSLVHYKHNVFNLYFTDKCGLKKKIQICVHVVDMEEPMFLGKYEMPKPENEYSVRYESNSYDKKNCKMKTASGGFTFSRWDAGIAKEREECKARIKEIVLNERKMSGEDGKEYNVKFVRRISEPNEEDANGKGKNMDMILWDCMDDLCEKTYKKAEKLRLKWHDLRISVGASMEADKDNEELEDNIKLTSMMRDIEQSLTDIQDRIEIFDEYVNSYCDDEDDGDVDVSVDVKTK